MAEGAAALHPWLRPYLTDVSAEINSGIDRGKNVLVEGTQGFGLSLYHSPAYPKTTSRDTSAAGCISECGISPLVVTNIVLVLRTFPIRVAGKQAGPMFEEIDWETIQRESGYPHLVAEYTTVTGKLRRVGRFDFTLARMAAETNRPTRLAVNFLDYISAKNRNARSHAELTLATQSKIAEIEGELNVPVNYVGVGPTMTGTFELRQGAHVAMLGTNTGREINESRRTA